MRHLTRRFATATAVAAVLTGAAAVAAPAASAVPPGTSFGYGTLICQAVALAGGDGQVGCTGEQNRYWRAKVTCTWGFTYYGSWQNNLNGGTLYSVADSNCLFGVADITVTSN
jgi:hypothetical protein